MSTWDKLTEVWYYIEDKILLEVNCGRDPYEFLRKAIMYDKGEIGKRKLESMIRESAPTEKLAEDIILRTQIIRNAITYAVSVEDIIASIPPLKWAFTKLKNYTLDELFEKGNLITSMEWSRDEGFYHTYCQDYTYVCENANVFGNTLLLDKEVGNVYKTMIPLYKAATEKGIQPFPMVILNTDIDISNVKEKVGASKLRAVCKCDTGTLYKYKQSTGNVFIMEIKK